MQRFFSLSHIIYITKVLRNVKSLKFINKMQWNWRWIDGETLLTFQNFKCCLKETTKVFKIQIQVLIHKNAAKKSNQNSKIIRLFDKLH